MQFRFRRCVGLSCLLSILLLTTGHALGALIAYDGFDYPAGDLTTRNGGTGWGGAYTDSGNSTVAETTGLTYPDLLVAGGSLRTADGGTATTISFRNLDRIYGDGETETWVSLLGRRNGVTANTSTFAGLSFYNSSGSAAANSELAIGPTVSGGTSPVWRIGDLNNGGTSASSNTTVSIDPNGTVYLLTMLIRWGVNDPAITAAVGSGAPSAVYLYVNPALGATPTLASANAARNINITNFDKIRFAAAAGAGSLLDYSFDEIRIGDTFNDVTPSSVPEPSAVMLGLVSLIFCGTIRTRRRHRFAVERGDSQAG
jgi:hypothetical protein